MEDMNVSHYMRVANLKLQLHYEKKQASAAANHHRRMGKVWFRRWLMAYLRRD